MSKEFNLKGKSFKHKKSGDRAFVEEEAGIFLRVYFEDENGEEGGDDKNPRVINRERFLEKFEETKKEGK